MGVPAFFRWLSRKYVSIIVDAVEERRHEIEGIKIPIDCTQPNLNYQVFILNFMFYNWDMITFISAYLEEFC
jgi:5'-3' exonuclease